MTARRRWDPAVSHKGPAAESFLTTFLASAGRKTLLVCGAGFDPRSANVAELLSRTSVERVGLLLSESRLPDSTLGPLGAANSKRLKEALPDHREVEIRIFDENAVVGGRNVVKAVQRQSLEGITDVVVDLSALSVGTAFPLVRYFVELHDSNAKSDWNLHVVATHNALLDASIRTTSTYDPDYVHGFKGGATLTAGNMAARLWLPQLTPGLTNALVALHKFVKPDDVCPILPFPASSPRAGDDLLDEYSEQLVEAWSFDPRNLVLAAEDDPLDLYRTLVLLNSLRVKVFESTGGSRVVLSPLGSKVTALGALMAALEEDLPVAYVEAGGYEFDSIDEDAGEGELIHVWLEGEAYPRENRPSLRKAVE